MIDQGRLKEDNNVQIVSKSKLGSLIGVLLILVSISAYVFFVRAVSAENLSVKDDIAAKNLEIDQLKTQIETYKSAEEEFGVTTEVEKIESLKAIPIEMDQDEVIRTILDIADTYDIDLKAISFSKGVVADQEGIGVLRISSSFEGSYLDLTDFLEGVEQNQRLFRVDNISVQITKLSLSDFERANFSLTIETYFQDKQ